MSWITVIMSPGNNKLKVDWIYLSKIVLSTVQGDQFLYILLEVGYKYNFDCYNISLSILQSLSLSLLFYTISPYHLYPPHAYQIAGVSSCPIRLLVLVLVPSAPSLSLRVVVRRLKTTIQVSLPH